MANNYDKIAKHYDWLSRIVFSKAQVNAQKNQLKYLTPNACILIVGGGTGWILEEIAKIYPSGLKIVYVEISAKMIALSKNRDFKENDVKFENQAIENFESAIEFDFILTPFLFDNFNQEQAELVFHKLNLLLKNNGKWFLVDFTLQHGVGKWWKSLLLKSMYLFFRFFKMVSVSKLVEMKPYFLKQDYIILEERFYFKNFIEATVYLKQK
ncbi:class I SAM-dependent methyltransferase [Pedobacter sp.]|uniref:class I SAM-dependent methyltransferase n=1 Tax=Pedobacter sp. TaxID=1411316 RepID=UPI003BA96DD1